VGLASRGQRDMDAGPEAISDAAELGQVRAQARKVHLEAFVAALILTGLALALPELTPP
jgi:hypothetical protein